ncbi:hypothetical protein [Paracoccus marinaquae]|uniref:Uncharacterized protein n=1 Tax=Paracoccus marinaquae TaxID=2841926 RepID=A0ABS6AMZ2_9RHOB|nr:hypothetical protein [Paracoccus marinaquae]MBU3031964.1 hypothetical protein [Paracoccus marinaquae]
MTKPPEKSKVVRKLRCAVYTRKAFSQVVHETRLGTGHVGDQSLQDPFMRQHTPFEVGGLG